MGKYFKVKVEFRLLDDGKVKKVKVEYLVDACSVTEAETRTVVFLNEKGETNFDVLGATSSSVEAVIEK